MQLDPLHTDSVMLLGGLLLLCSRGEESSRTLAAREVYQRADARGNVGGSLGLACMLESGLGNPEDKASARELYWKAHEAGVVDGTLQLARVLRDGIGGDCDLIRARSLFAEADAKGDSDGTVGLAEMARLGLGGPMDEAFARELYRKAHLDGNSAGTRWLARMRQEGRGGPRRLRSAQRLLAQAAWEESSRVLQGTPSMRASLSSVAGRSICSALPPIPDSASDGWDNNHFLTTELGSSCFLTSLVKHLPWREQRWGSLYLRSLCTTSIQIVVVLILFVLKGLLVGARVHWIVKTILSACIGAVFMAAFCLGLTCINKSVQRWVRLNLVGYFE